MSEYFKDFEGWHAREYMIDSRKKVPICKTGQVWWCSLGVNIGSEEDGKNKLFERPVIILHKVNRKIVWIVPLSSSIHNNKYRVNLKTLKSQVIISQIRAISTKRLLRRICEIQNEEMTVVTEKFLEFLEKRNPAAKRGISGGSVEPTVLT